MRGGRREVLTEDCYRVEGWISGELQLRIDGTRRRLRVGTRGGPERRARRHLRQVLRASAAEIQHGDTFQCDNVGVLCEQPQSTVVPPSNRHQFRCQFHLVRSCRLFSFRGATAF